MDRSGLGTLFWVEPWQTFEGRWEVKFLRGKVQKAWDLLMGAAHYNTLVFSGAERYPELSLTRKCVQQLHTQHSGVFCLVHIILSLFMRSFQIRLVIKIPPINDLSAKMQLTILFPMGTCRDNFFIELLLWSTLTQILSNFKSYKIFL